MFEHTRVFYDRKSPWENRARRHLHLEGMTPEAFEGIWRKQA